MERRNERTAWTLRTALVGVLAGLAIAAAACNTMEGAGEDIEAGGEAIQDAAK
ncbi:MAG: hypothetical protein KatS3mg103_0809 [Phycisphaerales bacterium]|nr:MAG: hypothetical protein KatS3mg103_0809 [Phycisphaerales bacterium]